MQEKWGLIFADFRAAIFGNTAHVAHVTPACVCSLQLHEVLVMYVYMQYMPAFKFCKLFCG